MFRPMSPYLAIGFVSFVVDVEAEHDPYSNQYKEDRDPGVGRSYIGEVALVAGDDLLAFLIHPKILVLPWPYYPQGPGDKADDNREGRFLVMLEQVA